MSAGQSTSTTAIAPWRGVVVIASCLALALTCLAVARLAHSRPAGAQVRPAGALPDMRLDLNRADVNALRELPGVGPALAARLVEHREAHGPWGSLEEVRQVNGVGPKTVARLRPLAIVE